MYKYATDSAHNAPLISGRDIKTYRVSVTMKSANGAIQMQIQIKIMLRNNDEIIMKLSKKCY